MNTYLRKLINSESQCFPGYCADDHARLTEGEKCNVTVIATRESG